jgi:hypothetical protein
MNLQELQQQLRENQAKMQNNFIDSILEKVEILLEKANRSTYKPTDYEREQFGKIATIIKNMSNWF